MEKGSRVVHWTGNAAGQIVQVITDPAPDYGERITRTLEGEDLPPFTARPAFLVRWDERPGRAILPPSWSREAYIRPE
jgi:hypothetical protein